MSKEIYNAAFYDALEEEARTSARHVIPVLLKYFRPKDVIDVGCGRGAWLAEFKALGSDDIWGVDGEHVGRETLLIEGSRFRTADLNGDFSSLFRKRFDLAVSLEVAEHIEEKNAAAFIASLAALSDVILFSAAVPYQGGTNHVNENWPEYWAVLFRGHGYSPVDCIRPRIWNNPDVCWWYRQNILVFAKKERLDEFFRTAAADPAPPLSLIHPELFLSACSRPGRGTSDFSADTDYLRSLLAAYPRHRLPEERPLYKDTHAAGPGSGPGVLRRMRGLAESFFKSLG
jgi:SAM-dependent methyltransferase